MFAPHAASIDSTGELSGHALTTDGTNQLSVSQAIEHFESKFSLQAKSHEIQATGIFYHSPGIDASAKIVSLPPANTTDECRAIVALLEHSLGDSVYLIIPYSGQLPEIEYSSGKLVEKPTRVFPHKSNSTNKPWWKLW